MTPPAATARHAPAPSRPQGRPATRPRPRPVPDRPRPRSTPPRPAARPARPAAPVTLGGRVARRAGAVVDSPLLDRLIAGRLWIPCIAGALMGLVLLQVSLLQLNSGIGRSVVAASALERENAALKAEVSRLDSGERIQAVARLEGLVMPGPGDRRYLTAGGAAVAAQAASSLAAPSPVVQQPAPPADGSEIVPADPVTPAAAEAAPTPETTPAAVAPADPAATAAAPAAPAAQAPAPEPAAEPVAPVVPDATAGGVAPTGG